MKSLPCVDIGNYIIDYHNQTVIARVADMKRFDQKQLLNGFVSRNLTPVWIETITPITDPPSPEKDIPSSPHLKPIAGEWRTDDVATSKFWLDVKDGCVQLHTTKLGYWTTIRSPIVSVGKNTITFKEADKAIEMSYTLERDLLVIQISAPSVFQGQFKLSRGNEPE